MTPAIELLQKLGIEHRIIEYHHHPVFVDEWATALDLVYCSGGRRGLEIAVAPEAFTVAVAAEFAPIASW